MSTELFRSGSVEGARHGNRKVCNSLKEFCKICCCQRKKMAEVAVT